MAIQLVLHPYRLSFHRPFVTAFGTLAERQGILLGACGTEASAATGWGEAAPLPGAGSAGPTDEGATVVMPRGQTAFPPSGGEATAQVWVSKGSGALAAGLAPSPRGDDVDPDSDEQDGDRDQRRREQGDPPAQAHEAVPGG